MKLKICGLKTEESIKLCNDLNIDFIGFNFVSFSTRFIGLKQEYLNFCNNIAKLNKNKSVGLFFDQKIEEIQKVLKFIDLDILQLHGNESPEFIKKLKKILNQEVKTQDIKIWKAFSIKSGFDEDLLQEYGGVVDLFLLDGPLPGSGNGIESEEELKKIITKIEDLNKSYGIAGGIKPKNIKSFKQSFPNAYLLDTASGVEKNKVFDEATLKTLVKNFHSDE